MSSQIVPLDIKLRNKSRLMELVYEDISYELSYEFLRVYSPSAEVRGHTPSQSKLQLNKIDVFIENIEFVGSYAIRILFDDGHNTGLYSWEYLNHLGSFFLVCTQISTKKKQKTLRSTLTLSSQIFLIDQKSYYLK